MNNDSHFKSKTLKITIAVIISLFLHLIFFTKFDFNQLFTSENSDQANELEIFVTSETEKDIDQTKAKKLTKPNNYEKKLSNNEPGGESIESKPIIKEDSVTNSKNTTKEEVAQKKPINKENILSNLSQLDLNLKPQPKNESLRIKNISAKSPEYVYRLYFEAWKKKVERMGSMNYPDSAKINNSFSNLIMRVTINKNGSVHNITIIKSSGNNELDLAATDIVKSGSPYAPFSEQMKKEVDKVNITRIWKFIDDQNFSKNK